jgi:hypothetical protein
LRDLSVSVDIRLRDLLLSFRALSSLPELLATSEEVRVPPLLGFVRFAPLCRSTSDAYTPGSSRSLRSDGATRRILFRPRGFSPPRRLAPHRRCGFVAPRCRLWGPSRFPVPVPPSLWRWARTFRSPRRGDPTKSSPRQQPFRIAAVVASLPFPSILPVSPTRLPGTSKGVANKFVGVLRLERTACAVSSRAAPLPEKKGGSGPPAAEAVGLPRGRAMTGATVADGRGRRNPRGYLPHRPKPVRNLHSPKPVEALPGDRADVHRGGRCFDREAGASCPPALVRCRPKPKPGGGVRIPGPPKRLGDSTERRCLPKQVRAFRAERRCLPKQVRAFRAGIRCLPKQASGNPRDGAPMRPKPPGTSGPGVHGLPKQVGLSRPLPERAG